MWLYPEQFNPSSSHATEYYFHLSDPRYLFSLHYLSLISWIYHLSNMCSTSFPILFTLLWYLIKNTEFITQFSLTSRYFLHLRFKWWLLQRICQNIRWAQTPKYFRGSYNYVFVLLDISYPKLLHGHICNLMLNLHWISDFHLIFVYRRKD